MKSLLLANTLVCSSLLLLAACGPAPTVTSVAVEMSPSTTSTATESPTLTFTPAPTPTSTTTSTPEPTDTPTPEPTDTDTPTPEPTDTPTPEPTDTSEPTDTETPTPEPTKKPTPKPTETPSNTEISFSKDFIEHTSSFPDRLDLRNRGERRKKGHLAVTHGLGVLGKVECAPPDPNDPTKPGSPSTRYDVREGRIIDIEGVLYKHTGAPKGRVAMLIFKVDFGSFGVKEIVYYLENPTERDPWLYFERSGFVGVRQFTTQGIDPEIFEIGDIVAVDAKVEEFNRGDTRFVTDGIIIYGN